MDTSTATPDARLDERWFWVQPPDQDGNVMGLPVAMADLPWYDDMDALFADLWDDHAPRRSGTARVPVTGRWLRLTAPPSELDLDTFARAVAAECRRQLAKWGDQRHPDGTGQDAARQRADDARRHCQQAARVGEVTWSLILREGIAEADAETDPDKLRAELVQCAAVIAAWLYDLDRRPPDTGRPAVLRIADDGLPIYRAGRAPGHLATRGQLRQARLSTAALPVAAYLHTMPYHCISPLFDWTRARPVRPVTERQRAALAAGREGRFVSCVLCGARTIREPGQEGAYCANCP